MSIISCLRPLNTKNSKIIKVIFTGEWNKLWVGVNGKWIELSGPSGHYGLNSVYGGQVKVFPTGSKSVTVIVPENGQLKIQTSGWESDPIDDCFGKSITRLLYDYCLGPGSDNDNIGLIQNYYDKSINFGIGPHAADSIRNPREGDIDTTRDFNLRYRIEQVSVTPPTTQPPAKLPTAPTQPPVLR